MKFMKLRASYKQTRHREFEVEDPLVLRVELNRAINSIRHELGPVELDVHVWNDRLKTWVGPHLLPNSNPERCMDPLWMNPLSSDAEARCFWELLAFSLSVNAS